MSNEQQTILAKMALLQGTIDQCKRTLGSSTAALKLNPKNQPNQPLVTKTTWLSTPPSPQPIITTLLRPQTTKLILTQPNSNPNLPKNEGTKPTPIKALVGGTTYIRTKSGNLVKLSALQKFQSQKLQQLKRARLVNAINMMKTKYQPNHSFSNNNWDPKKVYFKTIKVSRPPLIKKNQQCQFFAKTGKCRNGLTCVFQHDPLQVAICPRFLRRRCTHSTTSCPLSHVPNAHNMEHCSHFPRCTKSDCPYPHVQPTTSQICQVFADLGWCSKGARCAERHVRECPEFSTKGTCSNVGCRLRHIINRNHADHDQSQAPEPGASDEDGRGLFFTDLTGADLGGKRKANQQLASNSRLESPPSKGISHNSDRPVKRFKYDAMADNDDYVMFISSDEEEASTDSEKSAVADDHSCSLESEELESAPPDDLPEPSRSDPVPDPTPDDRLPLPLPQLEYHQPPQARIRSRLGSEEIEEGSSRMMMVVMTTCILIEPNQPSTPSLTMTPQMMMNSSPVNSSAIGSGRSPSERSFFFFFFSCFFSRFLSLYLPFSISQSITSLALLSSTQSTRKSILPHPPASSAPQSSFL